MKFAFNKYWIIIALITIVNILIFSALSKKLEKFVVNNLEKTAKIEANIK